ncbi:MAG: carboxypeptidase-like regulatory domain-containing protein [Planctomycetaceae bacterium]
MAQKELRNRRAAEDQAEHIELSKDWPLRFPANVQENELAGVIVDTEGHPVSGALIDCYPAFTGDETTTDELGMFRYKFDTEGRGNTIEVRFSKEGFSPVYRGTTIGRGRPSSCIEQQNAS